MRIPIFRSEAQATNEAPGSRIQARMNAQPFIQAALAKGQVITEAAKQFGDYALMRAKADAEVQYSEAMLKADEEMRLLAEDLEKNGRLQDVTDENGAWRARSKDIRDRLADGLSSRSMTNEFNARFNQQELSLRFQLRDSIQARIERQIAQARAARMQSAEDAIANGNDIAQLNLTLTGVGADTARLEANGLGNYEALTAQEYMLLKKGTERAAVKYLEEQDLSIAAASQLHEALRSDDPSQITDAKGVYVYSLMQRLAPEDRVALLKKVNGISAYVNGPSLEEERFKSIAEGSFKEATSSINSAVSTIQNGGTVPDDQWAQIGQIIDSAADTGIDPVAVSTARAQYDDASFLRDLSVEVKTATPLQVERILTDLQSGTKFGGEGIDTNREELAVSFLKTLKANMDKSIAADGGLSWANQSGQVKLEPVDTTFAPPPPDQIGPPISSFQAQKRIADAFTARDLYKPTPMGMPAATPTFLLPTERDQIAANFDRAEPLQKIQMISQISSDYGDYAPLVMAEIAPKNPSMGLVAGLYTDGRGDVAEKVLRGQAIIAAGAKPPGATPELTEPFVREIVSSSLSFLSPSVGSQLSTAINESALAHYTSEANRRGVVDFDNNLWQESVLAVTGYDKATGRGGIQEVRGMQTMLPPTMSADDAESLLPKLAPITVQAQREGTQATSFSTPWNKSLSIDSDTFSMLQEAADDDEYKAMVYGRDDRGRQVYALTYGQYGDSAFAVMTDAKGAAITFTFEDLMEAE